MAGSWGDGRSRVASAAAPVALRRHARRRHSRPSRRYQPLFHDRAAPARRRGRHRAAALSVLARSRRQQESNPTIWAIGPGLGAGDGVHRVRGRNSITTDSSYRWSSTPTLFNAAFRRRSKRNPQPSPSRRSSRLDTASRRVRVRLTGRDGIPTADRESSLVTSLKRTAILPGNSTIILNGHHSIAATPTVPQQHRQPRHGNRRHGRRSDRHHCWTIGTTTKSLRSRCASGARSSRRCGRESARSPAPRVSARSRCRCSRCDASCRSRT